MSNGTHSAAGVAAYRTVRELGARSPRSHAAIREPNELVVTYRYSRVGDAKVSSNTPTLAGSDGAIAMGTQAIESLLRDAKCLETNWHPNIARVRHVDLAADELIVATELVDGATLQDLFAFAAAKRGPSSTGKKPEPFLPLPVIVRILVDVLTGVHGLHGLRAPKGGALGVIHGALCPANVIVGKDGVARIINPLRPRPVQISASSEAVGYGAPEALDVGGTSDPRSDVHAVGVILWEALTGRRLYEETDPGRVLARQREEEVEPPAFSSDSPFAGLTEVVQHALAFDPSLRFKTAAEMGAALRSIAGARIATGSVVAAQVAELAGERIRARRTELDPSAAGARLRASLAPMKTAQAFIAPGVEAAASTASESSSIDAPAPMSRRATVPPAALAVLDTLGRAEADEAKDVDDVPPPSVREELSLRDLMAASPPLHESAMVGHEATPGAPKAATGAPKAPAPEAAPAGVASLPAPVPRAGLQRPATARGAGIAPVVRSLPAKPPPPVPSRRPPAAPVASGAAAVLAAPVVAEKASTVVAAPAEVPEEKPVALPSPPKPAEAASAAPVEIASTPKPAEAASAAPVEIASTPKPVEAASATPAPEWKRTPDRTFAPVTDGSLAPPARAESPSDAPPPPLRKPPRWLLGGAVVVTLVGGGLALRAVLSADPVPPTTSAATVRSSADLPSTTVTAPAVAATEPANAEAKAKAEADAKVRDEAREAEAKAKAEADAKARDEARDPPPARAAEPTPPADPLAAPRPVNPRPTAPTAPARPKKPYEPSGI